MGTAGSKIKQPKLLHHLISECLAVQQSNSHNIFLFLFSEYTQSKLFAYASQKYLFACLEMYKPIILPLLHSP